MKILLADDNPKVRSALHLILGNLFPECLIVEAEDTRNAEQFLAISEPTLLLVDWELPDLNKGEQINILKDAYPWVKVIAMSSNPEAKNKARMAGADGFISKGNPPEIGLMVISPIIAELKKHKKVQ